MSKSCVVRLGPPSISCLFLGGWCVTPRGGVQSCSCHSVVNSNLLLTGACQRCTTVCCQQPLLYCRRLKADADDAATDLRGPVERLLHRLVRDNRRLCKADVSISLSNKLSIFPVRNMSNRVGGREGGWMRICVVRPKAAIVARRTVIPFITLRLCLRFVPRQTCWQSLVRVRLTTIQHRALTQWRTNANYLHFRETHCPRLLVFLLHVLRLAWLWSISRIWTCAYIRVTTATTTN